MKAQKRVPLYLQIYEDLKGKIASGEYLEGEYLPSERELHEGYHVERATVRRALELLVKDGLLVKIPGAGSKVKGKDTDCPLEKGESCENNIAFVLPGDALEKITEPFTSNIFYYFERECKRKNYHLFYTNLTAEDQFSTDLLQCDLAGIVWVSRVPHELILQAKQKRIPSLLISNSYPDSLSILCDNSNGIYQAMEHLFSLGHRSIAYLGGTPGYLNAIERKNGYLSALTRLELPFRSDFVMTGDWSFDSGYRCTKRLLEQTRDFTAICCANDTMALGAMKALMVSGLSVPEDVSVIGFDNIESCRYSIPPLSTVSIDTELFAKQIMRSLLELIENREGIAPIKILIQSRLCVRDYTGHAN